MIIEQLVPLQDLNKYLFKSKNVLVIALIDHYIKLQKFLNTCKFDNFEYNGTLLYFLFLAGNSWKLIS